MSAILAKRKTRHVAPSEDELGDAQAIFQRHFEARFAPLPETIAPAPNTRPQNIEEADSDDSDGIDFNDSDGSESGWGGVSDVEEDEEDEDEDEDSDSPAAVQIIDHSTTAKPEQTLTKRELKALMSSRILDSSAPSKPAPTSKQPKSTDDPEDAPSLLAADLELHRLITESHLLTDYTTGRPATSFSGSSNSTSRRDALFSGGRLRHRTTDLRLQSLSANSSTKRKVAAASLFGPQKKMPMAMRKGIVGAAVAREAKRRATAKEEGVVLERATGAGEERRRGKKGVGGAMDRLEVGRMKGAELRLSKRDVMAIQGPAKRVGRKKKRH